MWCNDYVILRCDIDCDFAHSDHEMIEVTDSDSTISHLVPIDPHHAPLTGKITLELEDEIEADWWDGLSVHRQEYQEATGNEGATLDRWYRKAGLVFWPRKCYPSVLMGMGMDSCINALKIEIGKDINAAKEFADVLVSKWKDRPYQYNSEKTMLECLNAIGDANLLLKFISRVSLDFLSSQLLTSIAEKTGWEPLTRPLASQFEKAGASSSGLTNSIAIIKALMRNENVTATQIQFCAQMVKSTVKGYSKDLRSNSSSYYPYSYYGNKPSKDQIVDMLELLDLLGLNTEPEVPMLIKKCLGDGVATLTPEIVLSFVQKIGWETMAELMVPTIQQHVGTYFTQCVTLVLGLLKEEGMTPEQSRACGEMAKAIVSVYVKSAVVTAPQANFDLYKVLDILGLSSEMDQVSQHIIRSVKDFSVVVSFLIPLVITLHNWLGTRVSTCTAFNLIYSHTIKLLQQFASQPVSPQNWTRQKVGCGCVDCGPLDTFMLSPTEKMVRFRMAQYRRNHLESKLRGVQV